MPDTIFALASGAGPCAVSIIRISGSQSDAALGALIGRLPDARQAVLRALRDPVTGQLLDHALVLRFLAPASFTGEDGSELHVHGGRAVVRGVLETLSRLPGLRLAKPGEFTRRAFLNGKLDLTATEGLADLIEADTSGQRDQALGFMAGRLRNRTEGWRSIVVELQSRLEAAIDFADEDDIPQDIADELQPQLGTLIREIRACLADARRGEILRDGFKVVIAGAPNAGKSSLLNAIAKREVAIVSDIPGTTRDIIEVSLDLNGLPVTLVDTAGLRESSDLIEIEGIRRARDRIERADLVLWLAAPDGLAIPEPVAPVRRLVVWTKADLDGFDSVTKYESHPKPDLVLSAKTGAGIDDLLSTLEQHVRERLVTHEAPVISRERHRLALQGAVDCLERINCALPVELVAEEIRLAGRNLSGIIGAVDVEDVLEEIFCRFCIGK